MTKYTHILLIGIVLSISLILSSCSNSVSGEEEEHAEPFGVAMIMNGVEIAKQENGQIVYDEGDHLEFVTGQETDLITIRWISEDGDRFVPDDNEGYFLDWIVEDESVLEVEQHDEDGTWRFHLVGAGAGETHLQLVLMHNDHSDFTSLEFEAHVEEAVSEMAIQDEGGSTVAGVDHDKNITGSLAVNNGETSGTYTIVFTDHDGNELEASDEYELEMHSEDESTVTIQPVDGSPFSFTLTGVNPGETAVHFELKKEGHDHDHEHKAIERDEDDDHDHDHEGENVIFESPDIPVTVN
ncbi:MAG: hypothetical protein GVY02_10205 [Bacteroidetes bacterium]|jgi:hypothetical protein|nr:hypothetical protein [Bacteroidota bacterium]